MKGKIVNYSHSAFNAYPDIFSRTRKESFSSLKWKMYNCNQHKSSRRIIREMRHDKDERRKESDANLSGFKTQS
jgi:hypothetical protein